MEQFKTEALSFVYPTSNNKALSDINLTVQQGEFITLCGESGCGKTTLLRLLKPSLTPHGTAEGTVLFCQKPLSELSCRSEAQKIGFVMQNPDSQLVTDKVWHELAFGLESLGFSTPEIRTRVSEMASYFGIQTWFHKKVSELSGGQKQLLNLASVMAMQPDVLILDEPTSQLDTIAAQEFIRTLEKINRDLGTTVILSEHRLEEAFPVSDRIIVMEGGRIIADDAPHKVGKHLKNSPMYAALPTPARVYGSVESSGSYPVTVRDGRLWLEEYVSKNKPDVKLAPGPCSTAKKETVIELKDLWFRYEKNLPDVVKGVNLKINKGELFAITGGNGTGKSTLLSLVSGILTPYRGKLYINGTDICRKGNLYKELLGVLPQNPQSLFVKKTVYLDLMDMCPDEQLVEETARLCKISTLLQRHPYDLSGGEQQRAALAKVLLLKPRILILDEPTKGMDAHFKKSFGELIKSLKNRGVTVIMVSHDIEFCAENADRCALMFDGAITSEGTPCEFFAGNSFYTTAANKMARSVLPDAVLASHITDALTKG